MYSMLMFGNVYIAIWRAEMKCLVVTVPVCCLDPFLHVIFPEIKFTFIVIATNTYVLIVASL